MAKAPTKTATDDAGDGAEPKAAKVFVGKKQLIEAIVAASGVKAKTAKPVIEATLAEIGAALGRGEGLNVKPLGKVTVHKSKENDRADIHVLRLRQMKPGVAEADRKSRIEARALAKAAAGDDAGAEAGEQPVQAAE